MSAVNPHPFPLPLSPGDVETLERATLDAVPPEAMVLEGPWLVGLDRGTVGRSHSAAPLRHDTLDLLDLPNVVAHYLRFGIRPQWRVPCLPAMDTVREALRDRGCSAATPTHVQVGWTHGLCLPAPAVDVVMATEPHEDWCAVFLGTGFDPVDGASRVQVLSRAQHAVFAGIRVDGQMVAVGMGSYSQGWASVHGMRTAAAFRGQGMASRILDTLGREGLARGVDKVFLQVHEDSAGALSLYARRGLVTAWTYAYWS